MIRSPVIGFIALALSIPLTANSAWWPGLVYTKDQIPEATLALSIEEQELCMPVFEGILDVQDQREKLRQEMDNNVQLRKQHKLCKPVLRFFGLCNEELKYSRLFDKWLTVENKLATKTNELYIKADGMGCFGEVE
jgi:hypothetical protein